MKANKASKRAQERARQAELEEKLSHPVRQHGNKPRRSDVGLWGNLPVPFLALLCEFLDGKDCQRCADLFQWPKTLRESTVFRGKLRELSHAQREHAFCSVRPRRHRLYQHACGACQEVGPVRKCSQCSRWVCATCSPFVRETQGATVWCEDCAGDFAMNGT